MGQAIAQGKRSQRFARLLGMPIKLPRYLKRRRSCPLALPLGLLALGLAATGLAQSPPDTTATSFETQVPGTLGEGELGAFGSAHGRVEVVSSHGRTGSQCLRLFGGEDCGVELVLKSPVDAELAMAFHAERWTARGPFRFTVEAHAGEWKEIYDGSTEVRVGARFLTEVRAIVPPGATRLRFRCESPADTGILIDDLSLTPPSPAQLRSVVAAYPTLPVLTGKRWNPVARLDVDVAGTTGALELTEIVVALDESAQATASRVAVFLGPAALDYRAPSESFVEGEHFGEPMDATKGELTFTGQASLPCATSSFWVAIEVADGASIDARVAVSMRSAEVAGEQHAVSGAESQPQRLGVALRTTGDDGAKAFRIPGLVTTNSGALIAVYDIRWKGWGDLPGDVDVGMLRSTDRGQTWEPQRIIMDMGGDGDEKWLADGVGDPAILVDRETNTIFVLATWSHGNRAWNGSGPGTSPEDTGQLMLVSSSDDGVTWSQPRNLTEEVKDPSWSYLLQGPGRGITMGDGTLVFPAQFQLSPDEGRVPHSSVLLSRDHGATWTVGAAAKSNTTEAAVVETQDGVLMLNMRDNRGGSRSVYTSSDPSKGWTVHATSRAALVEPVCMASLIHVGREVTGKADGRLIFSNPNVDRGPRRRMALQLSTDFGATWSKRALVLDDGASAGYSCLTMIDAETVGILYEGSRAHMTFQRIPLAEL